MNLPHKNEGGFVSFFALMVLMILAFLGGGIFLIARENLNSDSRHEKAVQLRYDAESAIEKTAYDIENKNIILPENIKEIGEYVIDAENLYKSVKVSVKYESNGIRIFAVAEKNENFPLMSVAEGFMEDIEGEYKWKHWVKVTLN